MWTRIELYGNEASRRLALVPGSGPCSEIHHVASLKPEVHIYRQSKT